MKLSNFRVALAGVAILAALAASTIFDAKDAFAQARPQGSGSQTFTPQGRLTGSMTAIGAYPGSTQPGQGYVVNGDDTLYVTISGALSGITATIQGSTAAPTATNPWANPITVPFDEIGGPRLSTISGLGTFRANVSGLSIVRLNVSTLTSPSGVTWTFVGGIGTRTIDTAPAVVPTYSTGISNVVPAASATDFLTVTPTASSPTIRIRHVDCSGNANVAGLATFNGIIRTTADTGGTSVNVTPTPFDVTEDLSSSAQISNFSANPTVGNPAGGGTPVVETYVAVPLSTASTLPQPLINWDFGIRPDEQPIILRGTSQQFAINGNGASFPSGTKLNCNVKWTEQ